ncbi:MAG: hypothetical protein V4793_44510, partial [Paraburkholderia tropica]
YRPVTPGVAGSSPVRSARIKARWKFQRAFFFCAAGSGSRVLFLFRSLVRRRYGVAAAHFCARNVRAYGQNAIA